MVPLAEKIVNHSIAFSVFILFAPSLPTSNDPIHIDLRSDHTWFQDFSESPDNNMQSHVLCDNNDSM